MNEQHTTDFLFRPRPEAHAMEWDDLLLPIKSAVRDLLIRLDGAERIGDEEEVADCFLVYGSRGTGKTTVLLSAKEAVCRPEGDNGFFKGNAKDELLNRAQKCAKELKNQGIVWLDVLDLEPLPPDTNLLTTVLTRVRNALDTSGLEQKSSPLTSPFEEDADSARQLLGRLINDATLMWEDIQETDTRSRANRQVAAAVIYADFRERFKKAMKKLSEELGRRHGSQTDHCSIVLPIDNIDRSTDHLYSIIKLAQMVSCRHLWLVMAGDHQDIDSFLERAYWKELIRIRAGTGAAGAMRGKKGPGGEDEAFVMARRQAAAASQKLLPPSHRIEIQLVTPEETLNFRYGRDKSVNRSTFELLEEIPLTPTDNKGTNINLKDLLYVQKFVEDTSEQKSDCITLEPKYLTLIAKQALNLPARGVIDLWQLAKWACLDESVFQADKIAQTMLTNAIAGSELTSERGQYLQNKIIRQKEDGGGALILEEDDVLNLNPIFTEHFRFSSDPKSLEFQAFDIFVLKNWFSLTIEEDMVIRLHIPSISKDLANDELPQLVGAWLVLLYDILQLEGRAGRANAAYGLIVANSFSFWSEARFKSSQSPGYYSLTVPGWMRIPGPTWFTFQSYDVFRQRWKNFLDSLTLNEPDLNYSFLIRIMVFGLMSCIMKTFAKFALNPNDKPVEEDEKVIESIISNINLKDFADSANKKNFTKVKNYEQKGMEDFFALYTLLNKKQNKGSIHYKYPWMKLYLERDLPLLIVWLMLLLKDKKSGNENAITNFKIIKTSWDQIWKSDNFKDLIKHWEWYGFSQDAEESIIYEMQSLFVDTHTPKNVKESGLAQIRLILDRIGA